MYDISKKLLRTMLFNSCCDAALNIHFMNKYVYGFPTDDVVHMTKEGMKKLDKRHKKR